VSNLKKACIFITGFLLSALFLFGIPQTAFAASSVSITKVSVSSSVTQPAKAVIKFKVNQTCTVSIQVINSAGKKAAVFAYSNVAAKKLKTVYWDGKATKNNPAGYPAGSFVPAGKYTISLLAGRAKVSKSIKVLQVLPKPAKAAISVISGKYSAVWSAVPHAGGYELKVYKGSKAVKTIQTGKASYDITTLIKSKGQGSYKISVSAKGGGYYIKSGTAFSTYAAYPYVAVTGVKLNKTVLPLAVGGKYTLTASVSPANAVNKTVTWSSDNSAVAVVTGGLVTAKSSGTANITVRTADGNKSAVCKVTVTIGVSKITLNKDKTTLYTGSGEILEAVVYPANAANKNITWISGDTTIATVANGLVTAKKAGKTTITARSADGTKSAACAVTVAASFTKKTGTGVTAWNWFNQKYWLDANVSWDKIDPLPFLAQHGTNWLRVEAWMRSEPGLEEGPPFPASLGNGFCSRENELQVMRAGIAAGMKICLELALSDQGACASNQKAPAGWESKSVAETAAALHDYTKEVTQYYKNHGISIDMYEIGNEIEFGLCGYSNDTKLYVPDMNYLTEITRDKTVVWEKEAEILKGAIAGVKEADPDAKTMLHISTSRYPAVVQGFFAAMDEFGVDYDYGGLSYYPWFDPNPTVFSPSGYFDQSVAAIIARGKKVVICEYGYPSANNPMPAGWEIRYNSDYPFTPEGQAKWVRDFLQKVESNPDIEAVFDFFPDHFLDTQVPKQAWFEDDSHPKPVVYEYAKFQRSVPDTTPPTIKSVSLGANTIKNGGTLTLEARSNETPLYVSADLSLLDITKKSTLVLKEVTPGVYRGTFTISPGNTLANGSKTITVRAADACGNISLKDANISLANPAAPPAHYDLNDDFSDNTIDTDKWNAELYGGGTAAENGALTETTGASEATSIVTVKSRWTFTGDFDAETEYALGSGWGTPATGQLNGGTFGVEINGNQYSITRHRTVTDNRFIVWNSATGQIAGEAATTETSGSVRLIRAGKYLAFMYYSGGAWKELGMCDVGTGEARVLLSNSSIGASKVFTGSFDNFTVHYGAYNGNLPDRTPPVISSVSLGSGSVRNGDVLALEVHADDTASTVTADVSQLDTTKTAPVVLIKESGVYKANMIISPANQASDGTKTIVFSASDESANTATADASIALANPSAPPPGAGLSDDFNGTEIDAANWNVATYGGGTAAENGTLQETTGTAEATSIVEVKSKWSFAGDFDVETEYALGDGWGAPDDGHLDGGVFGIETDGWQYHISRLRGAGADDKLIVWNSRTGQIINSIDTSATAGRQRLVRAGRYLSCLYHDGSRWIELGICDVGTGAAKVILEIGSIGASKAFTGSFDNFTVNTGNTGS
jgi:uncharacterized protein YjdB